MILSQVLPGVSKIDLYGGLHTRNRAVPVLVLATYNSGASVVRNLGTNTSSCIIGPFGFTRLITHVRTLLQHPRRTLPPVLQ